MFIVVLPASASPTDVSVVGQPDHSHVDLQRNLSRRQLPVALAVPALVAGAFVGAKLAVAHSHRERRRPCGESSATSNLCGSQRRPGTTFLVSKTFTPQWSCPFRHAVAGASSLPRRAA